MLVASWLSPQNSSDLTSTAESSAIHAKIEALAMELMEFQNFHLAVDNGGDAVTSWDFFWGNNGIGDILGEISHNQINTDTYIIPKCPQQMHRL